MLICEKSSSGESLTLFMVSFDLWSLFKNIPVNQVIHLAVHITFDNDQSINITKSELTKVFDSATSQTHFLFNNKIYDKNDEVAIGSPLDCALANLFMDYQENKWLNSKESSTDLFYKRYGDKMFFLARS